VIGNREQLEQRRAADFAKRAVGVAGADAQLGHRAAAADHRDIVAGRAAGAVEQRPEAVGRIFDLAEVLEPQGEFLELARRHRRQRIAGNGGCLRAEGEGGQHQGECGTARRQDGPHLTISSARIAVWPAPHGREHSMT
jgi:hypothetical protein